MKFRFLSLCFVATLMMFYSFTTKVDAVATGILINMAPPNPAPYQNVTITLKSYVNNLDSVLISWSVDGKTITSGTGKKSFQTTAPGAGVASNVVATISLPDGTIDTSIIVRPSIMVLLWQANDSYVPPFYRGKALPTEESEVKVVAMPEIRIGSSIVPAENMTYYWKKDYTNNVDGSGYGKNFFIYTNDYLDDSNNVSVVASTLDQKYSAEASLNIETSEPKILFYNNDSKLGISLQNTLTDPHKIQGTEIVEAIPYFISPKELRHPFLVWKWFINDNLVNLESIKKNLMPLQAQTGTHGTSKLRLSIENTSKIFQAADKEINIEF